MQQEVLFEIKNLCKYFPASHKRSVKAVDNISLKIYRGETLSLVGESGCGKTTLGRTVLGIYPKTSGEICYKGNVWEKPSKSQQKEFQKSNQMIFQDPYSCLDPRMSIGSIIEEGMKVHFSMSPAERQKRCEELLERVGLPKECCPDSHMNFPEANVRELVLHAHWQHSPSLLCVMNQLQRWTVPSRHR